MKRLTLKYNWLYFIALCASLLTACEPTQVSIDKDAIAFKNAPASPTAFEGNGNARLFAYTTTSTDATPSWVYGSASQGAPANLTNVDFKKRTATFAVKGETKYWTDATYNFFSVYSETLNDETPAFEPTFNAEENKFTFSYSVADQQNELWAAYLLNEPSHIATNEEVDLEFNHILSKINFKIKKHTTNKDNRIVVTKVTISDVYTSGVYNLAVESSSATWTFANDATKSTIEFNDLTSDIEIAGTSILIDGFLVIPQTVGANKKEIVIDYSYYQTQSDDTPVYTKQVKAFLPISSVTNWEIGKNYVYNLLLSADENYIHFTTPTISDWGTSSVGSIIIQ